MRQSTKRGARRAPPPPPSRAAPGGPPAPPPGARAPQPPPGGAGRADPSPSRLAYRLNRLWLTPLFRRAVTMGLPALVLACAIALYLGDASRRATLIDMATELRAGFEARPEFRVEALAVQSDTPEVTRAIEARLGIDFPVSSFHLDLEALRARIEALDAVESAAVRIGSDRVLDIRAIEREPAFVWRHRGGLAMIDAEGNRVALLASRAARSDLPLIAGEGAPAAVDEARRLLAAAAPLGERLHALVRVGERRWDLVLAGDRRIMLPASGAVLALERVLALDNAPSDLLSRDVVAVDMRNPGRPTIRLSQPAMTELHRIRSLESGVRNR
ncbi:MAG: cell division protein FtsQ/DivIB [Pararhodobacter sp.]|nr:cell division protein FtsQ/DivIB [Pararhodobacter sp.]